MEKKENGRKENQSSKKGGLLQAGAAKRIAQGSVKRVGGGEILRLD